MAREPDGKLRFDKGRLGWYGAPLLHGAAFLLFTGFCLNLLCGFSGSITGSTGTSINMSGRTLQVGAIWRERRIAAGGESWHTELQVVEDNRIVASGIARPHEPLSLCGVEYYNFSWRPTETTVQNSGQVVPVVISAEYAHNPGVPLIATALFLAACGALLLLIPRSRVWCQVARSHIAIRWEPTAPPSVLQLATLRDLLGRVCTANS